MSTTTDILPDVHTMRDTLQRLAPGTPLRDGLDRIVRGHTGALIVLGDEENVTSICDGGFEFDVTFAATRLRELCKMDGAVVLSSDGERIKRANVQLIPSPSWPTQESGTRHRSAERTALQTGVPVIAVSESQNTITLYVEGMSHILEEPSTLLNRANQALGTMERYRDRLDQVNTRLHMAELHNYATVIDVVSVIQREEMLRRVGETIDTNVLELGREAKQIKIQLTELRGDNDRERGYIIADYLVTDGIPADEAITEALEAVSGLDDKSLMKPSNIARILGLPPTEEALDEPVIPRGYRTLNRVPRVQKFLMDKLVGEFGNLHALTSASVEEISAVDGVGSLWARHITDGLARLT
ncbi:DNA integrity scanning diadenylate cyclase DisA [Corynebacterium gallinarum]|uniref:DNA integrity scanning protein DisA n=1 Tax=Corynebacterium gallinarum TaxID=2762214 RepID=A0A8I0LFJ4_9CORY|nr:DNA integrity scanning diadenylate cyclase DisA [Corynebacterium gallinarum]MBD8030063.1 DNA integrity scanning protein DisA [Corynebacterium gallinarum]